MDSISTKMGTTAPGTHGALIVKPGARNEDLLRLREDVDVLTLPGTETARYVSGFAVSKRAVERALQLRYEVFNVELGEGLAASSIAGLDRDHFDEQMTHLIVLERKTGRVVGTYRLQTVRQGLAAAGLYSDQEYDLSPLSPWFDEAVECGRACIAKEHRSLTTLFLLWKGIAAFVRRYDQRWLFGCCSLTTTDPDDGWRAMKTIRDRGCLHPTLSLQAREDYCCGPAEREFAPDLGDPLKLPKLFDMYVRLGASVISQPALDRSFGTVDFLVLMDSTQGNLAALDKPVSQRLREGKRC